MARLISTALIALLGLALPPLQAATTTATAVIVEPTEQDSLSLTGIDQRLKHVERVLENQVILEMLQRFEGLQGEIRELRGEIEQQGFELQSMQKRQRDLYLDTDRRLRDLELTGKVSANLATEADTSDSRADSAPDIAAIDSGANDAIGVSVEPGPASPLPPADPEGQTPVIPTPDPVREKIAYTKAFNYLKEGRYEGAIRAFGQFLQEFPSGNYADNAQYWLGEANYVSRFFDAAIEAFNTVLTQYPTSPKLPDAYLKIGYAYYELENWEAARSALSYLEQNFPGTSAARLAVKRLTRMRDEGR